LDSLVLDNDESEVIPSFDGSDEEILDHHESASSYMTQPSPPAPHAELSSNLAERTIVLSERSMEDDDDSVPLVINATDHQQISNMRHSFKREKRKMHEYYEQQMRQLHNQVHNELDVWKMRADVLGRENLMLKEKVDQKSALLDQLRDQVLQIREENTSLLLEVDILKKGQEELLRERDAMWRKKVIHHETEIDSLRRQLKDMSMLREQRDTEWKEATAKLKGEFEAKEQQNLSQKESELDKIRQQLCEKEKELEDNQQKHSAITEEQRTQGEARIETLTQKLTDFDSQNEKLIKELEESNERFADLSLNYSKHSAEMSLLKEKYDTSQNERKRLQETVQSLHMEKEKLNTLMQSQKSCFDQNLSVHLKEKQGLQESEQSLQRELETLKHMHTKDTSEWQETKRHLDNEFEQKHAEVAHLNEFQVQLREELVESETARTSISTELAEVKKQVEQLTESNAKLQESSSLLESRVTELTTELNASQTALTEAEKSHSAAMGEYEKQSIERIQTLEKENSLVSNELQVAKENIEEFKGKMDEHQHELAELTNDKEQLSADRESLRQQVQQLTESNTQLKVQLTKTQESIDSLTDSNTDQEERLTTIAKQLTVKTQQYETEKQRWFQEKQKLEQEVSIQQETIQNHAQTIDTQRQSTKAIQESVQSKTDEINRLETQVQSVTRRLKESEKSGKALLKEVQKKDRQIDDLTEEGQRSSQLNREMSLQVESLLESADGQRKDYQKRVADLQKQVNDNESQFKSLECTISTNQDEIHNLETTIISLRREVEKERQNRESALSRHHQLTQENSTLEQQNSHLTEINRNLDEQCRDLELKHKKASKHESSLSKRLTDMQEKLRVVQEENMELEQQMREKNDTVEMLNETVDRLQRQFQHSQTELSQLQKSKKKLTREQQSVIGEMDNLKRENQNLRDDLENIQSTINHQKDTQVEILEQKLQALRNTERELRANLLRVEQQNAQLTDSLEEQKNRFSLQETTIAQQAETAQNRLREQISTSSQKIQQLDRQLSSFSTLQAEYTNLNVTLQSKSELVDEQTATISRLGQEIQSLKSHVHELQTAQDSSSMHEENTHLANLLNKERAQVESIQSNFSLLQVEMRQKEAQMSALQKQLFEAQEQYQQSRDSGAQLEELQQDISASKEKMSVQERTIQELQQDRNIWKSLADEKSDRVREYIKTIETNKEELFSMRHKVELLEKRNATFSSEIEDYKSQTEQLNASTQSTLRQYEELKDKLTIVEEENASLQSNLQNMEEIYDGKDNVIQTLRSERQSYVVEIDSLKGMLKEKEKTLQQAQRVLNDIEDSKQKLQQHQDEVMNGKEEEISTLRKRIEELEQQAHGLHTADSATSTEGVSPFASPNISVTDEDTASRSIESAPVIDLLSSLAKQKMENGRSLGSDQTYHNRSSKRTNKRDVQHNLNDDNSSLDPSEEMYTDDSDSDTLSSDESQEPVLSPRRQNQYASVIGDLLKSTPNNNNSLSPSRDSVSRGSLSPRSTIPTTSRGGKYEAVQRMIKKLEQRPTASSVNETKVAELKTKYHEIFKHIQRSYNGSDVTRQRRELLTSLHQAFSTALKHYSKRIGSLRTEIDQQTMEIQEHLSSTKRSAVMIDSKIKKLQREIGASQRHLKALNVRWKERNSKKGQNRSNDTFLEEETRNIGNDMSAEENLIRRYTTKLESFKKQREVQQELMHQSENRIEQSQRERRELNKLGEKVREELRKSKVDLRNIDGA